LREGLAHCKVEGHSALNCAKTAEPIKVPFGLCAGIGPRNHVLDGGADLSIIRGNVELDQRLLQNKGRSVVSCAKNG